MKAQGAFKSPLSYYMNSWLKRSLLTYEFSVAISWGLTSTSRPMALGVVAEDAPYFYVRSVQYGQSRTGWAP